jgi:hypothetical protein
VLVLVRAHSGTGAPSRVECCTLGTAQVWLVCCLDVLPNSVHVSGLASPEVCGARQCAGDRRAWRWPLPHCHACWQGRQRADCAAFLESGVIPTLTRTAQGNLILTDANYQILTLLRSHRDDAKGTATMAAHAYPIHAIRLRAPLAADALAAAVGAADDKAEGRVPKNTAHIGHTHSTSGC